MLQCGGRTCIQTIFGFWPPCHLMMSTWTSIGNSNVVVPSTDLLIGPHPLAPPLFPSAARMAPSSRQSFGPRAWESHLTCSFSHTTLIQTTNKSYPPCLPNVSRMRPFPTASTATVLAKPAPSHREDGLMRKPDMVFIPPLLTALR